MVKFTVTIQRPNLTTTTFEFSCPLERRRWVRKKMRQEIPGAKVIAYDDDVTLDEDETPPAGEADWYEPGKGVM